MPLVPNYRNYLCLSADGWREAAAREWPAVDSTVDNAGSCLAAAAATLGLAWEEVTLEGLDVADSCYSVLVKLACRKPWA
jgi:hypothetical protein